MDYDSVTLVQHSLAAYAGFLILMVDVCREDASRAISNLDGYGYDNLILRVEWAQPRAER